MSDAHVPDADADGPGADPQRSERIADCWAAMRAADARIRQIEVTWHTTRIQPPYAPAAIETLMAQPQEQAQTANQTPSERARTEQLRAEYMQRRAKGTAAQSRVTFLSDGKTVRAEIFDSVDAAPGQVARVIDIYDGANSIHLIGTGMSAPARGELTRRPEDKLSFSASGFIAPLFLFGSPLAAVFTLDSIVLPASISANKDETAQEPDKTDPAGADDTLTLEQTLPYNYPALARLTLSTRHWRPTRLLVLNAATQRVHTRYDLRGYRQYADGVWFPDTILQTATDAAGTLLSTHEYRLEAARFNADVDTTALHSPVPPGTELDDFRFGADAGVRYGVTTGIPDDAWVRRQLSRQRPGYTLRQTRMYRSLLSLLPGAASPEPTRPQPG